jgi:hypothetical protein
MVVTYRAWGMMSPMSAIGVFQADMAVDQHLKLSEPVEHDRWDPHSRRLAALPFGAEIVKAVEDRCKARLRDFLKGLQPPPPPPRNGLDWLGKMLAQILTPRARANPPPPTGDRGDVSIVTQKEPTLIDMGNGNVKLTATYAFSLKAQAEVSERPVEIGFRLNVLEGDDSAKGEQLAVRLSSPSEDFEITEGVEGKARALLRDSEKIIVTAESEEFSSDWSVSIHVEASSTLQGAEA